MTQPRKRNITGIVQVDGVPLTWHIKSEPAWGATDGDTGLRLSIMKHDETLTRHGTNKAWRELILQFPFVRKQRHASRFPEKPKVTPEMLTAGVRLAVEAGWSPDSRGRPFELVLEEGDLPS
jgi:hypothetical protein